MFAAWFGKNKRKPETRRDSFVPRVDGLEERLVPSSVIRLVPGFNANTLAAGHNKTASTNIGFSIDFYGKTYSSLFVNTSGDVTFGEGLTSFIPPFTGGLFPAGAGLPIIAPFWADVDTSGTGTITYGTGTLEGHQTFAVTWSGVGYATGETTPVDSFQMVLINRSDTGAGNFDIEFNYNSIVWDSSNTMNGTNGLATGTASGRSASVGFTAGSGAPGTFFILPNSDAAQSDPFTNTGSDALQLHDLNASTPGRYHFYFRNGTLTTAVTPNVTAYMPIRYAYNAASQTFTGNLSLVNHTPSIQTVITPEANLDELLPSGQPSTPVTVEFTQLPRGVTLVNETGVTASGHPYITINTSLGVNATLYVPLIFRDPLALALPNFYDTTGILTFLTPFDPTQH